MKRRILQGLVLSLLVLVFPVLGHAAPLVSGNNYRVEVDAIGSNGAVVVLGFSKVATATADGKISFSFSGLPDRTSYNFFVITVRDGSLTTDTIIRQSLVPVAVEGENTKLGVSLVTGAQTQALLSAMESAGSDNPIMVALGMTIVRNAAMDDAELEAVGKMGIDAATAFEDYLTGKGVTVAEMREFKSAIVSGLDDFSSLYKDSVAAVEVGVPAAETAAKFRGEAASLMFRIMVESATVAGFPKDYVYLAFEAVSAVVEANYWAGDYAPIGINIMSAIKAQMGSGMQNMQAENSLQKWTEALNTLKATDTQIARYEAAADTLFATIKTAFQNFEQLFQDPTQIPDATVINASQSVIGDAMEAAFNQFMIDAKSSDAEILTLRKAMYNTFFFGLENYVNPDVDPGVMNGIFPVEMFKFYTSDPNAEPINWPITMVVPTSWALTVEGNSGELTYTPRDTTAVPPMMVWLDSQDRFPPPGNMVRHDFGDTDENLIDGVTDAKNIPASLASLMGLREDIQILEMTKFANPNFGIPGELRIAVENDFLNGINTVMSHIGGTSKTGVLVTEAEKDALITLSLSPEF